MFRERQRKGAMLTVLELSLARAALAVVAAVTFAQTQAWARSFQPASGVKNMPATRLLDAKNRRMVSVDGRPRNLFKAA